ncbi:MAG: hypothetical protein ABH833_02690 [Parcubacteria group bacterium]
MRGLKSAVLKYKKTLSSAESHDKGVRKEISTVLVGIFGADVVKEIQLEITGNTVFCKTDSKSLAQEIFIQKEKVLETLHKAGHKKITGIRIK